jgi:PilZ domain-containing protein
MTGDQLPKQRRTTRLPLKVRVVLSGKDTHGFVFGEETETVMVSKHGAAVRTSYTLPDGSEVSLRIKDKNRVGQFEVTWIGKAGTPSEGLVGLEWLAARRFWGIELPPEDWDSE